MLCGDVPHRAGFALINHREDAIVRRDEELLLSAYQNRTARGSHPRIHDDDVNRARWEIRIRIRKGERAVENVEGSHAMVDVHNSRGGIDVEDDPLHGSDKMVARAKIRGERDDGI